MPVASDESMLKALRENGERTQDGGSDQNGGENLLGCGELLLGSHFGV